MYKKIVLLLICLILTAVIFLIPLILVAVINFFKQKKKKKFVTTPIFYLNRPPHIGTLVTVIYAQVYVRLLEGVFKEKVTFLTGTDNHGTKIRQEAEAANLSNIEFCQRQSALFKNLFDKANIKYDIFIQTTDKKHKEVVEKIWIKLREKGYIYLGSYSGYYSKSDEAFYQFNELIDNKAPSGSSVEFITQECYFFKASLFSDRLKSFLENHQLTIPFNRQKELINYIKDGLLDICVSRPNEWGIPVPGDANQTIYVWFDALINYLTAADYPKNIVEYYHFLGKDISNFHGVVWIALLMALEFPVHQINLIIHNWWIINNEKMSKSKGNIVAPNYIIDKYGIDAFTFYCLYNNLFIGDVNFQEEDISILFNSILVNKFSNLVYRVFSIVKKNNELINFYEKIGDITKTYVYKDILKQLKVTVNNINFKEYIDILIKRTEVLNKFIEDNKVWNNNHKIKEILVEVLSINEFVMLIFGKKIDKNEIYEIIFSRV